MGNLVSLQHFDDEFVFGWQCHLGGTKVVAPQCTLEPCTHALVHKRPSRLLAKPHADCDFLSAEATHGVGGVVGKHVPLAIPWVQVLHRILYDRQ